MATYAVDTNIVVRLLTGDDPSALAAAQGLFSKHTIFIADTVWLETEWVLRAAYRLDRASISEALHKLLKLPQTVVSSESCIITALEALSKGMDFADAFHFLKSDDLPFKTLDKAFCKKAAEQAWDVTLLTRIMR